MRSAQDGLGVDTDLDRETRVPPPFEHVRPRGGCPGGSRIPPTFLQMILNEVLHHLFWTLYKLRGGSKLTGGPLYMGFLYGVKIARLDDYMGFLYGAPPDLTVHFWAQKTQNNVSQKAQMLLQKIVTDSLPPPRFTASTTTLVSLPGRKPVLTTLARVPDPVVRVWTARKICVANPTQKK